MRSEKNRRESSGREDAYRVPSASTVRVCALVTREDVDQDTGVTVVVRRALTVTSTAVAGEGDGLPSKGALVQGVGEERIAWGTDFHWCARLCGNGEESDSKSSGSDAGKHLE